MIKVINTKGDEIFIRKNLIQGFQKYVQKFFNKQTEKYVLYAKGAYPLYITKSSYEELKRNFFLEDIN